MDWESVALVGGVIVTGSAVLGLTVRGLVGVFRSARRFFDMVDRVAGVPARGARSAEPGALDRLDDLAGHVGDIRAQLYPNGGGSLRDAVDKTRAELQQLDRRFTDHLLVWHTPTPPEPPATPRGG